MSPRRALQVLLLVSAACLFTWPIPATGQIRVQDTPALNGLGAFLFQDVTIQLDAGYGDDTLIRSTSKDPVSRLTAGIYVDKPFVSYLFDIFYDRDRYLGEPWERDTPTRDLLIEPIRFVAFYKVGDFAVLRGVNNIKEQNSEFYVGIRYKLDLGRLFRHVPVFQK